MFEISLRIQQAIMYDWSPYFTTNEVHKERNRYKTQAWSTQMADLNKNDNYCLMPMSLSE